MTMTRRPLKGLKPKTKMDPHRRAELKRQARIKKSARRVSNKNYYRRNKSEILRRARLSRKRHDHGDRRISRQMHRSGLMEAARLRLQSAVSVEDARQYLAAPVALIKTLQSREIQDVVRWTFYPKKGEAAPSLTILFADGFYVAAWRSPKADLDFTGPSDSADIEDVQRWLERVGLTIQVEMK